MARRPRWHAGRAAVLAACAVLVVSCAPAREVGGRDRPVVIAGAAASDPATSSNRVATDPAASDPAVSSPGVADAAALRATPAPDMSPPRKTTPGTDQTDRGAVVEDSRAAVRSMRPIIDAAVRDLAARVGVPPGRISVVLAQRVVWPDEQLGCPARDDRQLGDPQPGTRVHLQIDDLLYRYHTGGRHDEPFLCDPAARKAAELGRRIEPR